GIAQGRAGGNGSGAGAGCLNRPQLMAVHNNNYSTALDRRPVTTLRGAGPQLGARLEKLGIQTVQDLLFHLPLRYEDRTRITPIGALQPGTSAVIEGEVQVAETVFRGRRSLLVRLADGSGAVTL